MILYNINENRISNIDAVKIKEVFYIMMNNCNEKISKCFLRLLPDNLHLNIIF